MGGAAGGGLVMDLLRATWEFAQETGLCTDEFEPWRECFKAATLWPIGSRDGKLIGTVMLHGMPDASVMMHVTVKPKFEGKWVSKSILRAFKGWRPGVPVVTLVKEGDPVRAHAISCFGFVPMDKEPVLGYAWYVRK